jgi:hypothetical protein
LPDGFQQLLSGAFTSPHCSEALEFTVLTPIWTTKLAHPFLVLIFFIYNHSCHVPLFLSLSTPAPPKWISKLLEKNNFIFYFSQILKLCFLFLFLFFHIHFLEPILHHLTKSCDFKLVLWISGIQNKQPKITVHPLYRQFTEKTLDRKNWTHACWNWVEGSIISVKGLYMQSPPSCLWVVCLDPTTPTHQLEIMILILGQVIWNRVSKFILKTKVWKPDFKIYKKYCSHCTFFRSFHIALNEKIEAVNWSVVCLRNDNKWKFWKI